MRSDMRLTLFIGRHRARSGMQMQWCVRSWVTESVRSCLGALGLVLDHDQTLAIAGSVMTCMRVRSGVRASAKRAGGRQRLFLNGCDTWWCWSDWTHVTGQVRSLRMCIRSMRRKGVAAIFGLWAINREVSWTWLRLSTLGDFVSMLESAWELSNSLVLARL
jgi:hypothetical protein